MDAADEPPSEPAVDNPSSETAQVAIEDTKDSVVRLNSASLRRNSEENKNNDTSAKDALVASEESTADKKQAAQSPGEDSGKQSETTIDTVHTEESPVEAEEHIFDPSTGPLPDIDDEFLISALRSLQVDEDSDSFNQEEDFDLLPLEQGELEELQVDPEDQDLLPLQDFSNVFVDDEEEDAIDDNIAVLEENLNSLSIAQEPAEMVEPNENDEFLVDGEFPWYLLCRPCEPGMEDPALCRPCTPSMEDPASIQLHRMQGLSEEEQLQLSLLSMADNSHILDAGADNEYTEEEERYEESFRTYIVSRRREAVEAAISYTRAFGTGLYQPPLEGENPPNERTCFGHKETIYCVNFSECGRYLASASQDATVCVWDVATNSLLSTLTGHSKDHECLRVAWAPTNWSSSAGGDALAQSSFIASGGADGVVKVWLSPDPSRMNSWECVSTLDHGSFQGRVKAPSEENEEEDIPQIYALEFIEHWQGLSSKDADPNVKNSFLLTSSDDYVHLWDMNVRQDDESSSEISFSEVFSIRFTPFGNIGNGVAVCTVTSAGLKVPQEEPSSNAAHDGGGVFGGERNPDNIVYVFDASYCPGNGLLGVALSDGTLRLVNGRGVCVSVLSLPGCNSNLTSFSWDSTGSRLASCVATGLLILWNVNNEDENGRTVVSCAAVLEGGHQLGRPLFGAKYCGVDSEDLIVSWGVDGRLCLWDSHSHGQIHAPISTLISRRDYPIYAVDISSKDESVLSRLAVGGGIDAGFLGMPLYLYDVERMPEDAFGKKEEEQTVAEGDAAEQQE